MALINSGAIRGKSLGDEITMTDIIEALPFGNSIDNLDLKGSTIRDVLEKSARLLSTDEKNTGGGFIQVSGNNFKNC